MTGADCNILSNGRDNYSRDPYGKTKAKLSREPPNYVGTSTTVTQMHLESLQSGFQKDCTVMLQRYNLRRGGGNIMTCACACLSHMGLVDGV